MALLKGQVTATPGILSPVNGGTGIANNVASTITISGAFATTFTISGVTSVTLPTSGTLATTDTTQTISGVKTFTGLNSMLVSSSGLTVRNPANTAKYTITGTAIVADRILNLPLTTATDTLACLGLAQTFTANQTFSGDLIKSGSVFVAGGNGVSANRFIAGLYTTNAPVIRLVNGGSIITPQFQSITSVSGSGSLGVAYDTTNGLSFTHGNGTTQIVGATITLANLDNTAGSEDSDMIFSTQAAGATVTQKMRISNLGNIVFGAESALATNANDGHTYIPTCAGTPTGTPTSYTGKVAMIYDTTNNKFYIYNGSWKGGTVPGTFV